MTTETSNTRGVHTCSYACERPECIRAQRDELASRLTAPPPPAARGDVRGLVAKLMKVAGEMRAAAHEQTSGLAGNTMLIYANKIEALAAEGVQAGEVEQRAWNDEAAWGLAALAEAAGAERDSDDYGTWWTLRIEHFNALSQQPEARGVVRHELCDCPNGRAEHSPSCAALTGERNG